MKTIKQIADEIGVSKQAVQKRIIREPLYTHLYPCIQTKNGTKYIDIIGENLIKSVFNKAEPTTLSTDVADNQNDNVYSEIIKLLREDITTLKEQLDVKDSQIMELQKSNRDLTQAIENMTESIKAAQVLHAGTMQRQLTDGAAETTEPAARVNLFTRIFKKSR